jgi:hypothetical protein
MPGLRESLETGAALMVFVGVYMKWIRPIVDKIFGIDGPKTYLDADDDEYGPGGPYQRHPKYPPGRDSKD